MPLVSVFFKIIIERFYNNNDNNVQYRALVDALSAHLIHINLNTMFYAHVEHSPANVIDIRITSII